MAQESGNGQQRYTIYDAMRNLEQRLQSVERDNKAEHDRFLALATQSVERVASLERWRDWQSNELEKINRTVKDTSDNLDRKLDEQTGKLSQKIESIDKKVGEKLDSINVWTRTTVITISLAVIMLVIDIALRVMGAR